MLVAIIVLFAVCWTPIMVDNVLVAFGVLHRFHYGPLKPMRQAFACMSYFNSCVNPIVYAFMSRNFRQSFKFTLCACVKGEKYRQRQRYGAQVTSHPTITSSVNFSRTEAIQMDCEPRYHGGVEEELMLVRKDGGNLTHKEIDKD